MNAVVVASLNGYHATRTTQISVFEIRYNLRQDIDLNRRRLAVTFVNHFNGTENVVAGSQTTNVIRIGTAYQLFERKILVPIDSPTASRIHFQRLARAFGTIGSVGTEHTRRFGRVVGVELYRIIYVATRNRADRHRICSVGNIDKVGIRTERLWIEYRVFQSGIALGIDTDDTVGQFAGRRIYFINVVDYRRRTDKYFHLDRGALASTQLLIEIERLTTHDRIKRHGVARMHQGSASVVREPFHFRFLGFRIQNQVLRQNIPHAIRTGVGHLRFYRAIGITQADFRFLTPATVVV